MKGRVASLVFALASACSAVGASELSEPASSARPTACEADPPHAAFAAAPEASLASLQNTLEVRVLDVGPGLACIAKIPGKGGKFHYFVYDAGHWNTDSYVLAELEEMMAGDTIIDLMVLSHSDSDHLGAVDEICDKFSVRRILHSGMQRTTGTWQDADSAIKLEKELEDCIDINLSRWEFPAGATYRVGDAFFTMVCGFGEPPSEFETQGQGEFRNAGSIVMRLEYAGKSILFCGDAVGRHIGDPEAACIATERFMVEMSPVITVDSDVIVAPHHGADNGSSTAFIQAVSPEFVIFGAGHDHQHPTQAAAQRYINAGVALANMFRTDLGDDESNEGSFEWSHGRVGGTSDPSQDDEVVVLISQDGQMTVAYDHAP